LNKNPLFKLIFLFGIIVNLSFVVSVFSHLRIKCYYPFELVHKIPGDGARDNLYLPEYNKNLAFPYHIQDLYREKTVHMWDRYFYDSTHFEPGFDLFMQFRGVYNLRKGINIYDNFLRYEIKDTEKELPYRGLAFAFTPIDAYTIYNFFALFKVFNAYALWIFMQEILLFLSVFLTRKIAVIYNVDKNLSSSLWLLFSPIYVDLYMGQAGIIISFLIMLCIYGAQSDKAKWLNIGFLTSLLYKLTTVFYSLVLLRMRKYWIIIISFTILFLSFFLSYVDHPENFKKFLYQLGKWDVTPYRGDFSFKEIIYLFLGKKFALNIGMLLRFSTIIAVGYISLKVKNFDPPMLFALWSSAYFLLNLRIWEHHFVMILPAIVYGYIRLQSKFLIFMFIIIALPTPYFLFNNAPWTSFRHLIYFSSNIIPAILVFLYLLVYHFRKGFYSPIPLINRF